MSNIFGTNKITTTAKRRPVKPVTRRQSSPVTLADLTEAAKLMVNAMPAIKAATDKIRRQSPIDTAENNWIYGWDNIPSTPAPTVNAATLPPDWDYGWSGKRRGK